MWPSNHHSRWQMWTTGREPRVTKTVLHVIDIHAPLRRNARGKILARCDAVVKVKLKQQMPSSVDVLHQYPRMCRSCIRSAKVAMKAIEDSA